MQQELKSCPFCGSDKKGIEVSSGGIAGREASYCVRCHKCMAASAGYGTFEIATYHWNTRTESVNQKLVEALNHIKKHQELVAGDKVAKLSTTWIIANKALAEAEAAQPPALSDDELRLGLIDKIGIYQGWEESAVKMVDECIMPYLIAAGQLRGKV